MHKYKIIERVGQGSQADVFLAVGTQDDKKYVIKKLNGGTYSTSERAIMTRLKHQHVIPCYEAFQEEGHQFIVLDHAAGGDLNAKVVAAHNSGERIKAEHYTSWMLQLASALQYIHANRIIHRDIKLENVFVSEDEQNVFLGDFGVAKNLESTGAMTTTFVGSPVALSPEIIGGMPYSTQSDMWAFGCVSYELAVGKRPFDADNIGRLVYKVTNGMWDPLPADVPRTVQRVIKSLLSSDPVDRMTASEVVTLLSADLENGNGNVGTGAGPGGKPPIGKRGSKKEPPSNKGGKAGRDNIRDAGKGTSLSASTREIMGLAGMDLPEWIARKKKELAQVAAYIEENREADVLMKEKILGNGLLAARAKAAGPLQPKPVQQIQPPPASADQARIARAIEAEQPRSPTPELNANRANNPMMAPADNQRGGAPTKEGQAQKNEPKRILGRKGSQHAWVEGKFEVVVDAPVQKSPQPAPQPSPAEQPKQRRDDSKPNAGQPPLVPPNKQQQGVERSNNISPTPAQQRKKSPKRTPQQQPQVADNIFGSPQQREVYDELMRERQRKLEDAEVQRRAREDKRKQDRQTMLQQIEVQRQMARKVKKEGGGEVETEVAVAGGVRPSGTSPVQPLAPTGRPSRGSGRGSANEASPPVSREAQQPQQAQPVKFGRRQSGNTDEQGTPSPEMTPVPEPRKASTPTTAEEGQQNKAPPQKAAGRPSGQRDRTELKAMIAQQRAMQQNQGQGNDIQIMLPSNLRNLPQNSL